jgi:WD40 repeat protein
LRIWDAQTGELVFTINHEGVLASRGVAWSPDGLHIAHETAGIDAQQGCHLYVLNALTGDTEHDTALGDCGGGGRLTYSPDGSRIATSEGSDGGWFIYDAQTGKQLLTLPSHGAFSSTLAYSPDGSLLATGGGDNLAQLWDARTGKELLQLFTPSGTTYRVAFSPDGSHLAVQGDNSTTYIFVVHISDLMALAKSRLTRTLTDAECQTYLHVDTCPADGS